MRCIVEDSGPPDERGWRPVKCKRCKRQYGLTPHPPERFNARCRVLPFSWEWGYWLTMFLKSWGVEDAEVHKILRSLGFKSGCGCQRRRQSLNSLGFRFNQALAWLTGYNTP